MLQASKSRWRYLLYFIIALAVANVVRQLAVTSHETSVFSQARPWYLVLAVTSQLLCYLAVTPTMRLFYAQAGIKISWPRAYGFIIAGLGLAKIIPFGEYLFWRRHLKNEPNGLGVTTQFMVLFFSAGLAALALIFIISEAVTLLFYPTTQAESLARAFILVPIAFSALVAAGLVATRFHSVREALRHFAEKQLGSAIVSPLTIIHRRRLSSEVLSAFAGGFLLTWTLEATTLYLSLAAFNVHPPFMLVVFGYAFARLFTLIPIFPGGIGEVEAATVLFFAAYGFPSPLVLAGTILFRFLTFWLPILVGVVAYFGIKKSPLKVLESIEHRDLNESGLPAAEPQV